MKNSVLKSITLTSILLCVIGYTSGLDGTQALLHKRKQNIDHNLIKPSISHNPVKPKPTIKHKKLTLLVYMAGDNNLEPYIEFNRKQIEKEGVSDDMNMLLFMCTHRINEPKIAVKAIVKGHKTTILEKIKGLDSGDKRTLIKACEWAASFDADYLCLDLWDHGSGPLNRMARRGICYDNTTGNFLSDIDLRDSFDYVCKNYLKGKKIGFIGFDACLMGALEIAAAIQPYARYMLASEHTIPAIGWPYHLVLRAVKQGNIAPESFGRAAVAAYKTYYDQLTQDYTLSLIDLDKLEPLTSNVNALTALLQECITQQKNKSVTKALREAAAQTTRFDEPSYADLYDWYNNVLARTGTMVCINESTTTRLVQNTRTVLTQGLSLIKQAVLASVQGTVFDKTRGLLIYLPEKYIDNAYVSSYWAQTTPWTAFLQGYIGA